jgi:bifunctional DNA-binding transcriptional regulator/antitoxin component of YhaV-PrlF toxin-antitoxin module
MRASKRMELTVSQLRCFTVAVKLYHGFVGVQGRGTVALPADLRRRYHLDEPGAQVEITEREDGVLEVRPAIPVPATQAWFWTPVWQQREREVEDHVAAGRVAVFEGPDDFVGHLRALEAEEPSGDTSQSAPGR